ncbi:MAG TPA: RDD family protein [Panacibacter sp.]|nr:RDD family protein [Panacibacter sp.]HNP43641.1 RDD family protein [Panacibacter sp.]
MEEKYPDLSERVQSTFIDTVFVVIMCFAFATMLDHYENAPDGLRIAMFIGIFFAYEPVCQVAGCTIGNYLKKIRVKKYKDTSKRLNMIQAMIRYPVKLLLGWISFLTINSNPKRRAIHDLASGSVMIKI